MHKINVVLKYFLPVTAGIEVNTSETYSKLTDRWNISVHTSTDTLTEKAVLAENEVIKNINVTRYPYKKFGFWPKFDWQNTDMVALHNFNVFPHFVVMGYVLLLKILQKKRFALFLTPHGGFNPEWSIFPKHIAVIKKLYHYTAGTLMINLTVDGVRAVSQWEGNEIIKRGVNKNKVRVISNGIEDDAYKDIDNEASDEIKKRVSELGRYIIQIGRVYVIKNYETVIRALPLLPNDIKFVIVGPVEHNYHDNYQAKLEALADELGVKDRVIFFGVVRGVDKYYMIKHAELMVHMALWESFCNVVHEAMSQGKVCIVSNTYALPYLIKDGVNGFSLDPHDHKGVAEKVNYALDKNNSSQIKQIEETNRHYGLQTSWTNVADSMYEFYEETLNKIK
jgi:glycosyltransferase involved in cell wall biosynthesis